MRRGRAIALMTATALTTAAGVVGVVATSVSHAETSEEELALNFKASGRLVAVLVSPGDRVRAGHVLARVDPTDAQIGIFGAEAGLESATAEVARVSEGLTPEEIAQANVDVIKAQADIDAAVRAAASQRAAANQNAVALQAAVDHAYQTLAMAQQRLAVDEAQLAADRFAAATTTTTTTAPPGSGGSAPSSQGQDPQQKVEASEEKVEASREKLLNAQQALSNALLAQSKGRIQDQTQVDQADAAVRNAQLMRTSAEAANAVKAQSPKAGELARAQAGVKTAEAQLASARLALTETELRAPAEGTVLAVNGAVGETPGGGSGGGGGTPAGSSEGSGDSGSSEGFITLLTVEKK